jgi:HD-GYP domain-containing protein (c-di-GMP phosphodiesterase class II)
MNSGNQNIQDFFRHLLSATANASLYGTSHPQVERLSSQAYASICKVLEHAPEYTLMVIDNELVIDGTPQELNLFLNRLIQILKSKGIGVIKVLSGITREELDILIAGLTRHQNDANAEIVSSAHLRLGRVEVRLKSTKDSEECGDMEIATPQHKLPDMPKEELARLMDIYTAVKKHQKLKISGIYEIVSGFVEVFRQEAKPLLVMATLRETDEYTFTHSTNVCILNMAQAMALGIEGQLLNDIGVSAMLHDIGKLFIPEDILTKPGKLSDEEFDIMKLHPIRGARYLLDAPGVPRMAAITAYEHHTRYNLSGYPKLPSDWRQNLCSHMTMISDFFDALRTRRPYREPMELQKISSMMLNMMGTELHPRLTSNFLHIICRLSKQ